MNEEKNNTNFWTEFQNWKTVITVVLGFSSMWFKMERDMELLSIQYSQINQKIEANREQDRREMELRMATIQLQIAQLQGQVQELKTRRK